MSLWPFLSTGKEESKDMTGFTSKAPRQKRRHVLKYAASALALANILTVNTAVAQSSGGYATGGEGKYKSQIVWFSWGNHNQAIPDAGLTKTNTYTVAGRPLVVTCTLSNISGTRGTSAATHFSAYAPGNWRGDGLDDLYNQGQTGSANRMAIGLVNTGDRGNSSGDFTCSATYDGKPYALEGLVFADAESTNSNESIGMTLPAGATFRFIEGFRRDCTKSYRVSASAAGVYSFAAPDGACDAGATNQSGPMGIGFIDGATSASFHVTGGGKQAIALGVMTYIADTGDAPVSYGNPSHIPKFTWQGGEVARGTAADIFDPSFAMATPVQPDIRLGATVDVETTDLRGAGARGDDDDGISDEDALSSPVVTNLLVGGQTYTLSDVLCTATPSAAPVYGYIDFNRNGVFDVATERSQMAMCSGVDSSVDLSWTVPADIAGGDSYLRLRTAAVASEIDTPDSLANSGEVEDHKITLVTARVTLKKELVGRFAANDQFTVSVREGAAALAQATTTGTGAATSATATTTAAPVTPGQTVSLREAVSAGGLLSNYNSEMICVATADDVSGVLPTFTKVNGAGFDDWNYTPVAGQDVVCTVTNTGKARLNVSKTTQGGFGGPFSFATTNLDGSVTDITTAAHNTPVAASSGGLFVTDVKKPVTVIETPLAGYQLTSAICTDANASGNGNPAQFGSLSGAALSIDPANLRPAADITCNFVNGKDAVLRLDKSLTKGRYLETDQFNLTISEGGVQRASVTTTGAGSAATGQAVVNPASLGVAYALAESGAGAPAADLARYSAAWSCTNASQISGAQTPSGATLPFNVTLAAGDDLTCTISNTRNNKGDLSIAKTNTIANGPNDQAGDTLLPNTTTTYVITITNNGPDDVTGAQVHDPAPSAPLSCPAVAPVTCMGGGCPAGPISLSSLQTSPGLTLGTIANGAVLTLSYSCNVQ